MKIIIKTKNIKLNRPLKDYIEEKLNSLEKFLKTFQKKIYYNHFFGKGKPRIEAWVEIGKESLHHRKGPVFRAEVQMRFPGMSLRAEAVSKNLRTAITEVKDELQREFKQYKEKITSLGKRKTRALKKDLRLSPQARFYRKGRIREEGI
ncbi:MAG: ribosome hibernation-promoting factor, HPF/YfiA family [Candidatus Nealsonbacteria bacterium]